MNLAPIVLFTYNRLDHTKQTIEALQKNGLALASNLYIYSDGPKNTEAAESVAAVRSYLQTVTGFQTVTIIERDKNWGLADSIVDGVTSIVREYGKIIVLEDDIVTSPFFLQHMNNSLTLYQDQKRVMHVSGYFFPVDTTYLPETFFYNQTSCWGWGTWSRAWECYRTDAKNLLAEIKSADRLREFDMDGNFKFSSTLRANIRGDIKTWAIKWHASVFLKNGLCLHPKKSLVVNIGHDGSGVHSQQSHLYETTLANTTPPLELSATLEESIEARRLACDFLKRTKPSMMSMIMKKIWK